MLRPLFLHKYLRRRALKKKLSELENQLQPYVKFWGAWIRSDECFLNSNEIALINGFILNKFSVKNTNSLSDEILNEIDELINKLKEGFIKFQLWMAYIFITAILRMAEENGDEFFFYTPIDKLPISYELKSILAGFRVDNLNGIFENYSPDDFGKSKLYLKIVEFERALNLEKKSLFKQISRLSNKEYAALYFNDG
jgi:hypothetical protein